MTALPGLSPSSLLDLAVAVEASSLATPCQPVALSRLGFGRDSEAVAAELDGLWALGLSAAALGRLLRLLAAERASVQGAADRAELVWTGPEARSARSRDTAVVVREMFSCAERSVHVSTYILYQGRQVFGPLAEGMDRNPQLRVRMFVNIPRPYRDDSRDGELVKRFADEFRRQQWPGSRLPELYFDPRSLATGPGPKASLHAKAIVVDDRRSFVTSANFTEAAHDRNIEAGVLLDSVFVATSLRLQFDSLVESGHLRRVPLPA